MIAALLLAFAASPACVARVYDGDTVTLCPDAQGHSEKVRIADIDAPEMRGSERCNPRHLRGGRNPSWCDEALAVRSRDALRLFLGSGRVTIRRFRRDSYGRTLALIAVDGKDAGQWLREQGLARRWK